MNVKVPTASVIKSLETKLTEMKKAKKEYEGNEAKHQTALEKWRLECIKIATKNISKATNIRVLSQNWRHTDNIDFDLPLGILPPEPEREFDVISTHQYETEIAEITNALNILRISVETTVNASTMKAISKYL